MAIKHPLNLMAEHFAARSKDIVDRDKVIEELLEALIENLTHLDEAIDRLSSVGLGTNNTAIQDLADRTRAAIAKATN